MQELDARTVREWGERYSNWGRWGEDDERGTLNFITPERVLAACALPRSGLVISCALPFDAKRSADRASAAATTRSTPCWPPAPTRWPARRTSCPAASTTPTTR